MEVLLGQRLVAWLVVLEEELKRLAEAKEAEENLEERQMGVVVNP